YDLYCLFWGLNMNMLDVSEMKWLEDSVEDIKRISEKVNAAAPLATVAEVKDEEVTAEPKTAFSKMKAFVRKAVDCCIE
ncbi:MAG: hypothetical protein J6J35_03655, partial [Alphaproteobacteria bacterium]|nr:hypothetical protein [Alphaproteobacteria bacterium]